MYFVPSFDFSAVVVRLRTSDPADGSVIARQILFCPDKISGMIFALKSLPANRFKGGAPTVKPTKIELTAPPR
jgi:hypothetical protein